jgi:class 3 adenylate cyclase/tetratricopeptide (TPR) repeat protein
MSATVRPRADVRSERLKPYVPRLLIEWLRTAPDERHRAIAGSLAFVDISGFTQMTERLARKGKVGAEEVNDTLDVCFTELLSVAYDYGAGVIKWGGDAVLLLFDGEAHEARACRAAAQMQRTLRALGRLRTSAGLITLRMSVGISSGTFDFFLVGDLHRELVIGGPAATETVAMENVANAGDIVLSASTAAVLEPGLVGAAKGEGFVLRGVPDLAIGRAGDAPDTTGIDLARCLPIAIREHLMAGGGEAEHRPITVAFVEIAGLNEMLEQEGPDALGAALDDCIRRIQYATFQHQVAFFETDIAFDAVKVLLIAGAPVSSGNDAERMLRALRAIAESPGRLPVRIGVNSGRVFCGNFGPPYRRTYSVKGDAVNLAARLMTKAEIGQILSTDLPLSGSRVEFDREALEPFLVKGKAQPIQAYAVGAPVGARAKAQASVPLVGRERELDALVAGVEAASAWEGRVVELTGEPGMGKSRLLEEVRDRTDVLALSVACEEYEASTPYFPFRSLLRSLLAAGEADHGELERLLRDRVEEVAPHLVAWLPLLAILLGLELPPTPEVERIDEHFRRERLHEVARDFLGLILSTPTLLVFEDVHWLDDASRELLAALVSGIDVRPWLLVLTHRGGPGLVEDAERIDLQPLSEAEAEALVHVATEALPLAPHAVAALAGRSGGNPLFLSELVAAAGGNDDLGELPDSVEALLGAQIDRLSPPDRRLLRSAAVVGATFSRDLLATALAGEPEVADEKAWRRLGAFVMRGGDGSWHFRHALVRDAAYEGLPYRRRRDLHARIGEAIEQRTPDPADEAELLSLHFFHAQRFEEAWRYSRVAGDRAYAIYANVESAAFYVRALEAARRLREIEPVDVAKIEESLGDVRLRLSEFDQAAAAFRAARLRSGGDRVGQARLMLQEALVRWRAGQHPAALRWIQRGIRLLERCKGREAAVQRASFYVWYAICRANQGRPAEASDWCRRAIRTAKRSGAKEPLAQAYVLMDFIADSLGRSHERDYSPLALAIYEELGNVERQSLVLNNMGARAYFRGAWDEARDLYERARQAGERAGNHFCASLATGNLGEVLRDQGRLDEAEPLFREVLRLARASKSGERIADVSVHLGRHAAYSGRFDDADAFFSEARVEYERQGNVGEALATDARIAESRLLAGDAEAALALANEGLERAERLDAVFVTAAVLHRVRGCALIQLGRLEEARQALAESLREAREKNVQYEIALALDALVVLGRQTHEPVAEYDSESRAISARLGIVDLPSFPLGLASQAHQP